MGTDLTDLENNPIVSFDGRKEMVRLQNEYQIKISSICCDYFMEFPLQSVQLDERLKAQGMLMELIRLCPEVGIRYIELPLIGRAGLEQKENAQKITALLNDLVPMLEKQDVYLLLEVSLSPEKIVNMLKQIPSNRIQINYDTGNSAYWEYNSYDEIPIYGNRIGNIHIKDCTPEITVSLWEKGMWILI